MEKQELNRKWVRDEIFPVRYVDQENNITQKYPFNPNGSPM